MEEERKRVMIRIPDTVCKLIDLFAGRTHTSRPDVIIDACRQFYTKICTDEMDMLKIFEAENAPKEIALAAYHEQISETVDALLEDYDAYAKDSRSEVSILVVFPPILLTLIENTMARTMAFKNRQYYIRAAFMFLFRTQSAIAEHVKTMNDFVIANDVEKEISSLREKLRKD